MRDNKAAEDAALEEMSILLDQTRPKHIGTGISSGIGYILAGAVGACGIAVLSPHVAATKGAKKGGLVGGVVGGLGGAVAGAFNAVNAVGGGEFLVYIYFYIYICKCINKDYVSMSAETLVPRCSP